MAIIPFISSVHYRNKFNLDKFGTLNATDRRTVSVGKLSDAIIKLKRMRQLCFCSSSCLSSFAMSINRSTKEKCHYSAVKEKIDNSIICWLAYRVDSEGRKSFHRPEFICTESAEESWCRIKLPPNWFRLQKHPIITEGNHFTSTQLLQNWCWYQFEHYSMLELLCIRHIEIKIIGFRLSLQSWNRRNKTLVKSALFRIKIDRKYVRSRTILSA